MTTAPMTTDHMTTEYVTLPQSPPADVLASLLAATDQPGLSLSTRTGQDASGTERTIISLSHADAEAVAQARQHLLQACLRAKVRAFVV